MSRSERRNLLREVEREKTRVMALLSADQLSGAGFPIDQQLRAFLSECNKERLNGSETPFSTIWNCLKAHFRDEPGKVAVALRLNPERDHAFHGADFFAFIAENDVRAATFERLSGLAEGAIHNYSVLGDVRDCASEDPDGGRYVLSGVSFVRVGDRLHWLAIGGPICDLDAVTAERRSELLAKMPEIRAANPYAEQRQLDDIINKPQAAALAGADDVWRTVVLGVFNIKTQTHEIRVVGREWSISLAVFSDEFELRFAEQYGKDPQATRLVDKAMAEIEKARTMFELAESAFALPAYFAAKVELVFDTTRDTALRSGRGPDHSRSMHAPADARVLTRSVVTIGANAPARDVVYTPPRFRVELDGFYRRISPDTFGKDKDGSPLLGKTWVKAHMRWKDRPAREGVVRIKAPLGPALERAEARAMEEGGEASLRL